MINLNNIYNRQSAKDTFEVYGQGSDKFLRINKDTFDDFIDNICDFYEDNKDNNKIQNCLKQRICKNCNNYKDGVCMDFEIYYIANSDLANKDYHCEIIDGTKIRNGSFGCNNWRSLND